MDYKKCQHKGYVIGVGQMERLIAQVHQGHINGSDSIQLFTHRLTWVEIAHIGINKWRETGQPGSQLMLTGTSLTTLFEKFYLKHWKHCCQFWPAYLSEHPCQHNQGHICQLEFVSLDSSTHFNVRFVLPYKECYTF